MPQLSIPTKSTGQTVTATEFNSVVTAHNTNDTKLSGVAVGATANDTDINLKDRANHTGTQSADTLVDGATNKAFTAANQTKLSGIATAATANDTDINLKARSNHTGTQSADTIIDGATNKVLTAAEKTKLTGIATGATANSTDTVLLARVSHTGTQSADTVIDGTANKVLTAAEKTKLTGVATGATANSTDATLLSRTNHTGSQAQSTITNLVSDLAAKQAALTSGTTLKTVGNQSLLGSGNLDVPIMVAGKVPDANLPDFELMDRADPTYFVSKGSDPLTSLLSLLPTVLDGVWEAGYSAILPVVGSSAPGVLNMAGVSVSGVSSNQIDTETWWGRKNRHGYLTAATASAKAILRTATTWLYFPLGFSVNSEFCPADPVAGIAPNKTFFQGMLGTASDLTGVNIGNYTQSLVAIGWDPGDTNLSIYTNDGLQATANKVSLGVGYPVTTSLTDVYEWIIWVKAGVREVNYTVIRKDYTTGAVVNQITGSTSAKLPADTRSLSFHTYMCNNTDAVITRVEVSKYSIVRLNP